MNKSNQSEPSRHNGRRLSAVVGILVSAALMAGPLMSFADDSSNQSAQTQNAQTSAQTGQQPADGQAKTNGQENPKGGVSATTPSLGGSNASKSQGQMGQSAGSNTGATPNTQNGKDAAAGAQDGSSAPSAPSAQDAGADQKPQLASMLAYNKRAYTGDTKMFMDFVLRVKHDSVNPYQRWSGQWVYGGETGLQLFYSDGNKNANNNGTLRRLTYLQTIGNGKEQDTPENLKLSAAQWTRNHKDFYTIQSVQEGADGYDYLSISAQGRVTYPEQNGSKNLGGTLYTRHLYAVVGKNISINSCDNGAAEKDCEVNASQITGDNDHATDIAKDYPVYLYSANCKGDNCGGPMAYTGDGGDTGLFSGGQANWGMHLDNGLSEADQYRDTNTDPGVAPAKSFFTMWTNPGTTRDTGDLGSQMHGTTTCGNTTSFYYEWFGLKQGKWVPVTSLNSGARSSNGQTPAPFGASPADYIYADGYDGKQYIHYSFNANDDADPSRNVMGDTAIKNQAGAVAQKADGSIDFAQAKADQGLDGYFKMVAWPTTTDPSGKITSCVSTQQSNGQPSARDVYNPLYGGNEAGVSEEMAEKNPEQAQYLMNLGFDVNTAFDGYNYQSVANITPQAPKSSDSGNSAADDSSVDHNPKMQQMLSYDDKIDSQGDEMRADFVVRVAQKDVNPSCVGLAGNNQRGIFWHYIGNDGDQAHGIDVNNACGMRLTYSYNGSNKMREAKYFNTWSSDNKAENTDANRSNANYWWARDVGALNYDFFTIRDVQNKDGYSYLTISLKGDVDYPDSGGLKLGGQAQDLNITFETNVGKGDTYKKNIGDGFTQRIYHNAASTCSGDSAHCDGPISSVAYNETHPTFWSGGEANWGLTLDQGFNASAATGISSWSNYGEGAKTGPGIAPANTFFTRWYNPNEKQAESNLCNKVDNYYIQWFAMKDGDEWEPVKELTPTAQKLGQTGDTELASYDTQKGSRVNEPSNYGTNAPWQDKVHGGLLVADSSYQNSDGSIDFGKIRGAHPEYNGYFKMVTWPISTDGSGNNSSCIARADGSNKAVQDVYNPLYNKDDPSKPKGATDDMSSDNVEAIIAKGWTINTVFDNYSYSSGIRNTSKVTVDSVDVPHTVKPNGDFAAGEKKITIKGTDNDRPFTDSKLDVYAVYMGNETGQDNIDNPTQGVLDGEVQNGAIFVGEQHITTPGNVNWSMTVEGDNFNKFFEHVKDSQKYRFIAVDRASGNKQSAYGYLNKPMDMTPIDINAPKINYWKLEGKLSEKDAYNGFDKVKLRVTWGTGSDDHVDATPDASSGVWKVTLPQKFALGHNVKIDVTDPSNNESATYTCFVPKPVKNLPLTGSWLLWLLLLLLILATAEVIYRRYKHNKEQASAVAQQRGGVVAQSAVLSGASHAVSRRRAAAPRHTAHRGRPQRRH